MTQSMTNRLGEILVDKGFITPEQLYAAIKEQKKHRQRLGSLAHAALLKKQPLSLTTACAAEAQRAHRENQPPFSLHSFSISHRGDISPASNDPHYNQD